MLVEIVQGRLEPHAADAFEDEVPQLTIMIAATRAAATAIPIFKFTVTPNFEGNV